jgi:hypothetical protein
MKKMEKKLLPQIKSKKGISEMVSYALLIIIAVGLSVGVFFFLKTYIPKYQTPECPENIHVSVEAISCRLDKIEFEVVNKGLFTVDALYVRLNPPGREIKSLISRDGFTSLDPPLVPGNKSLISKPITPKIVSTNSGPGYTLEIQPAVFKEDGNLATCESVIRQKVTCSATG